MSGLVHSPSAHTQPGAAESNAHGHTPEVRASVRVRLVNPESGYESDTEAAVSAAEWAVIDAVLCGRGQTYVSAHDLLEALILLEREMVLSGNAESRDYGWLPAITKTRAAIAKATGQ